MRINLINILFSASKAKSEFCKHLNPNQIMKINLVHRINLDPHSPPPVKGELFYN